MNAGLQDACSKDLHIGLMLIPFLNDGLFAVCQISKFSNYCRIDFPDFSLFNLIWLILLIYRFYEQKSLLDDKVLLYLHYAG